MYMNFCVYISHKHNQNKNIDKKLKSDIKIYQKYKPELIQEIYIKIKLYS